ncbi:carboxyphosphonoenolpyruvate mutase [Parathielavia appendiculata]|uniref:Carboxyphosphonoenolpyruvate mutase n=1 Tax=Parathielavia appendiculata TaxID=2587402 RepID=A0AAN6TW57_9PEZI|nr:carboxyphosphonoenolpyruvate mutase [Parathielavia appendiculata]
MPHRPGRLRRHLHKVASSFDLDFLYLAGSGATGSVASEIVAQNTHLPLIADADTGFGGPLDIRRTIQLYEHAGVAGCHIKDQVFPKRCGQLKGKDVVDLQVYLERIRSAVEARTNAEFAIIARTDARNAKSFGGDRASTEAFREGVRRLKEAMAAGADMAFMESTWTKDEMRELVRELAPHPVMIDVLPDGLTGNLTTAECEELGFAAAIYPCTGFISAMLAMQESYRGLKDEGSDLNYCRGKTIVDFFEQLGLKEAMQFDERIENWSREEVQHTSEQLES